MSQRYIGGLIYNPPGGFSGYFDGNDDLNSPSNAAFTYGTSDFTIEGWFFITGRSGPNSYEYLFAQGSSTGTSSLGLYREGGVLKVWNGSAVITGTTTLALNTWNHIALSRSGTTMRLFLNGVQEGSSATNSNSISTGSTYGISVGRWTEIDTNYIVGYVSNFRVVKGTAVYTSAFTPPVGPLQAITNTSLLTCAYPTFRDGSTNNFTITVNGNTAVSVQNPFPLTQLPNPALGNQGNGVYSMSQYQALRSQNLWPAIDQYWPYVTMMLHGNGTNGAQNNTFLDSSTNNFTITRNGNTTQGTFTPYGSNWSNYFGGSGNYLTVGAASNWQFLNSGASDYTIEAWIFFSSVSAQQFICATNAAGAAVGINFQVTSSATLTLEFTRGVGGSFATFTSTGTVTANAWNHVAVTFATSGKTASFYINGAAAGSSSNTGYSYSASNPSNTLNIAREPSGSGSVTGYISNLRITNTIVYSSAFTPNNSPLTAVSGTSLLTCQSNRFLDNSTNAFAITVNGSPSVQRFSPFNPTTPYAAGTIGGSGYFDGSGDYLSVADNAALDLSTGDFTIECWVFPITGISDVDGVISKRNQSTFSGGDWRIAYRSASTAFGIATGANNTDRLTPAVTLNAWNHIAFVRSSGTLSCYANGVRGDNLTWTENLDNTEALLIGLNVAGYDFPGYISNVRIVKGSAVYSGSTYTVPTAPLTAITNTSLLCSFTNGGIIDNAMMNDLETVGNAQISTSVVKYGTGSLYFDGNGDYLTIPPTQQLNFGSGNFTFEFWAYLNTTSGSQAVWHTSNFAGDTPGGVYIRVVSGAIEFAASTDDTFGTRVMVTSSTSLSATTWTHVACVRNGNTLTIYINGTSSGSATFSGSAFWSSTYYTRIGYWRDGDIQYLNAYLDDLRITRGYARYTANFTPQRSQWQDQ